LSARENAGWVGPIPWDEALKTGHYDLDANGKLKPEIRDIVHLCADRNVALFFGHATHAEIYKLAEEVEKPAWARRIDPLQPVFECVSDMMSNRAPACCSISPGMTLAAPGRRPQIMYNTIVVGVGTPCDDGEPLPRLREAMRLVRGYMEAFGLIRRTLILCARPGHGGASCNKQGGSTFKSSEILAFLTPPYLKP
jgi:hypothetical protein